MGQPVIGKERQVTSRAAHGALLVTCFSECGIAATYELPFNDKNAEAVGSITIRWVESGIVCPLVDPDHAEV